MNFMEENKMFGIMFKNWTNPKIGKSVGTVKEEDNADICDSNPNLCGMEAGCYATGDSYMCLCSDLKQAGPNNSCDRSEAAFSNSANKIPTDIIQRTPNKGSFGSHQLLGMLLPSTSTPLHIPETTKSQSDENALHTPTPYWTSYAITLLCILVIVIVIVIVSCTVVFIQQKRCFLWCIQGRARNGIASSVMKCTQQYVTNPTYYSNSLENSLLATLRDLEIRQEDIETLVEIGEGCFGKVYKGLLKKSSETSILVAIKTLKNNISPEAMSEFEREVHIMASFRHENILRLLGVVLIGHESPQMVFEFMQYGDLAQVLRDNNPEIRMGSSMEIIVPLTPMDLIDVSFQITKGMKYLFEQHFVHRDLATRNCLVGDNLQVKISDFGMSRDIYTSDYYKVGGARLLPVRWMSPESITYGRFSLESDVWSYGVVLWEIFTYGKQPYYGHCNEQVIRLIIQGDLLKPPQQCPPFIATIMTECWKTDLRDRMAFNDIYSAFLPHVHRRSLIQIPSILNYTAISVEPESTLVKIEMTPM